MGEADTGFYVGGFVDVAVCGTGRVYLLAILVSSDDPDALGTRLYFGTNGNWRYLDFPEMQLVRVCAQPVPRPRAVAASGDGRVVIAEESAHRIVELPRPVADIGNMTAIRAVGPDVFACGVGGQVYRFSAERWASYDDGLFQTVEGMTRPEDLVSYQPRYITDVDGRGAEDLYVVGLGGLLYRRDAKGWRELIAPTNRPINTVLCTKGSTYLGSAGGLVFVGEGDRFEKLDLPVPDDVWGLAEHAGEIYVATQNSLWVLRGGAFEEVDTGLDPPLAPYRLVSGAGQLWSVSQVDVAWLEEGVWRRPELGA